MVGRREYFALLIYRCLGLEGLSLVVAAATVLIVEQVASGTSGTQLLYNNFYINKRDDDYRGRENCEWGI